MGKERQVTYCFIICSIARTIAILESENLFRESPFKSLWIDEQKNREKDLDEELALSQRPIPKCFF